MAITRIEALRARLTPFPIATPVDCRPCDEAPVGARPFWKHLHEINLHDPLPVGRARSRDRSSSHRAGPDGARRIDVVA